MPPQSHELRDPMAAEPLPDANCPAVRKRSFAAKKQEAGDATKAGLKAYTVAEVAKHNVPSDCWLMIKGKVYDVTGWGEEHPGGKVIYTYGGERFDDAFGARLPQDATDVFSAFHGQSTWLMLRDRLVGTCIDAKEEGLVKDFRELRAKMQQERMFECSPLYYVFKARGLHSAGFASFLAAPHRQLLISSNLAILASSLLLIAHSQSYTSVLVAAALLGLFWQQCGWLAHDFLHHQVFKNRSLNNAAGLIIGNLWQGFSVAWWKSKHNTHHAVPNKLKEESMAMDPDIDTLPLLAWSGDMVPAIDKTGGRFFVRHQHILFVPVLLAARLSWALQSATFSFGRPKGQAIANCGWERAMLALHYLWYISAAFALLPPGKALLYVVTSQLFSGFFLSFVFIMSHNGMEVYDDGRNFIMAQMAATRNIDRSLFNDWFTGGLNQQIEHHLFPTLPRHNLKKAQKLVRALCSKHGVYYEECSLGLGFTRVVKRLREVAMLA